MARITLWRSSSREQGLPLHYPRIFKPELLVKASLGKARRAVRVRVTRHLASRRVPVPGARVRIRGSRARTGPRGRARLALPPVGDDRPIVVRARKRGFRRARVVVR